MTKQTGSILVVFDLVSTLTNAGPRYVRAFQEVCAQNGVAAPDEESVLSMLGNKNLSEITDLFAGQMEKTRKDAFMSSCNQACDTILNRADWHETLYPNVRETVTALHQNGIVLGVFTGTREDAMENQLAYHGITDLFDVRYRRGKDNVRDSDKTSSALKTEQLNSIVAQFRQDSGSNEATIIVVGDSSADAKAAASAGLSFVGFAENKKKKEELEKAGVEKIISDLGELSSFFGHSRPVTGNAPAPTLHKRRL